MYDYECRADQANVWLIFSNVPFFGDNMFFRNFQVPLTFSNVPVSIYMTASVGIYITTNAAIIRQCLFFFAKRKPGTPKVTTLTFTMMILIQDNGHIRQVRGYREIRHVHDILENGHIRKMREVQGNLRLS